jgi:hypothetical protein
MDRITADAAEALLFPLTARKVAKLPEDVTRLIHGTFYGTVPKPLTR